MIERVLPAPNIYASCPQEGKILEYYAGTFDAVYLSLSPFVRPVSISPKVFCPETYPNRRTVVATCEAVSWNKVMALTGLPSLAAVDIGLRTQIHGLKAQHENQEFVARLDAVADAGGIIPPNEGVHSDLLHNQVLSLFQELGHDWVWVGDEFCTQRKLHWIEDLKNEQGPTVDGHCNVFSPDKSLLWTVHWDSHFSFLCSSRGNLDRIKIAEQIEGFFCTSRTEVYWSVRGI